MRERCWIAQYFVMQPRAHKIHAKSRNSSRNIWQGLKGNSESIAEPAAALQKSYDFSKSCKDGRDCPAKWHRLCCSRIC
jgi:hypothetical protein